MEKKNIDCLALSVHDWFGLYSFHFTFNPLFVCSGWALVMAAAVNNVLGSSSKKKTINTKELYAQIGFVKCMVDICKIIIIT